MIVKKFSVRQDITSCNFCDKGQLNTSKMGLIFPYENVVHFSRSNKNGLSASMCEECLDEFYQKAKQEFSNETN